MTVPVGDFPVTLKNKFVIIPGELPVTVRGRKIPFLVITFPSSPTVIPKFSIPVFVLVINGLLTLFVILRRSGLSVFRAYRLIPGRSVRLTCCRRLFQGGNSFLFGRSVLLELFP